MAEESGVIKDPSKKKFWTARNIGGLFILAIMPLTTSKVSDFFSTHSKLVDRVEKLEEEQANNKAIWTAITDQRNRMVEIEIEHKAGMLAIDREFRKSNVDRALEKLLDRELGPKTPEPNLPVDPLPPSPAPVIPPKPNLPSVEQKPIPPDQFREAYEQKFPVKKK
jgi:hypothetical protein